MFHSVAVYGMIAWGGIYKTHCGKLTRLQERLLKLIGIKEGDKNCPLSIKQVFVLNSITYLYNELKTKFNNVIYETRNKRITIPKHQLPIGQRSYVYYANIYFNELPIS